VRYVCAGCPHVRYACDTATGLGFAKCDRTGHALPQHTKPLTTDYTQWLTLFWRIPVHCPLPNHRVEKSAAEALTDPAWKGRVGMQPMERWRQVKWTAAEAEALPAPGRRATL
jgi:hypothetical protein